MIVCCPAQLFQALRIIYMTVLTSSTNLSRQPDILFEVMTHARKLKIWAAAQEKEIEVLSATEGSLQTRHGAWA